MVSSSTTGSASEPNVAFFPEGRVFKLHLDGRLRETGRPASVGEVFLDRRIGPASSVLQHFAAQGPSFDLPCGPGTVNVLRESVLPSVAGTSTCDLSMRPPCITIGFVIFTVLLPSLIARRWSWQRGRTPACLTPVGQSAKGKNSGFGWAFAWATGAAAIASASSAQGRHGRQRSRGGVTQRIACSGSRFLSSSHRRPLSATTPGMTGPRGPHETGPWPTIRLARFLNAFGTYLPRSAVDALVSPGSGPARARAEALGVAGSAGGRSWRGQDSNLRRQSQRVYSASPLTAREPRRGPSILGAGE